MKDLLFSTVQYASDNKKFVALVTLVMSANTAGAFHFGRKYEQLEQKKNSLVPQQ